MNLTPVVAGFVTSDGKLKFEKTERQLLVAHLRTLANQSVELTVKVHKATRSSAQNRFWWGVVIELLANELGYQKDEMHEALKFKFLRLDAEPDAHGLTRVRSTASLNTKEFTDLIENVITWAGSEFGINIPLPGEADGV